MSTSTGPQSLVRNHQGQEIPTPGTYVIDTSHSSDFFHVEEHPSMVFKSTGVTPAGDGTWDVAGDLTIRGVTKPVVLHAEFEGAENTPFGDQRIGFSASTEVNREDWDLGWNVVLESGGLLVGKKIKI